MRLNRLIAVMALASACAKPAPPAAAPAPVVAAPPAAPPAPVAAETVTVRDATLEREAAQLRMELLERSAQLADAERRYEEATTEVVRAMARLRSLATRAEAASAIAEAEVTLRQLRGRSGQQVPPEVQKADASLKSASRTFDEGNYAGAVYLATEAKRAATLGRGRIAESGQGARAGESSFAVPVPLSTTTRTNLRAGPSISSAIVTTVDAGTALTGLAYAQEWVRVTLDDGRTAWVHQALVKGTVSGAPER
ncbi:MAG: SH3 domain-containing protein [Gemmatimonadota bacterium]|nr:SH3 domain-containing protein [Gemmatimonadota bacterium]